MNSRELRIGNYVRVDGNVVRVNGITQHKIGYCPKPCYEKYARSREVEPVLLTEDIVSCIHIGTLSPSIYIHHDENGGNFVADIFFGSENRTARYLHKLQNLYFELTEKELEVIL